MHKLSGAHHSFPDIWLEGKVDDESHRNNMWLEAIIFREKPDVWGQVPIADHKVKHATTILASMSAGKGDVQRDDNTTKVPAPATLSNNVRRVVVADDDPWELSSSSNEGDHIFHPLLVGAILDAIVAVQVQGEEMQGPSLESNLRCSVANGSWRLVVAMHDKGWPEE